MSDTPASRSVRSAGRLIPSTAHMTGVTATMQGARYEGSHHPGRQHQADHRSEHRPGLGSLQHLVGGDVELVGLRSLDMNMYLNEEGKLMSLPRNHRATVLCQQSQAIRIDDYICGDAVIVGPFEEKAGHRPQRRPAAPAVSVRCSIARFARRKVNDGVRRGTGSSPNVRHQSAPWHLPVCRREASTSRQLTHTQCEENTR
ncbi:DUF3846 domain-containing protein [Amycolatopsis plumensis]|uniref:DUF3846 domain-containing protein n=1 Tax=Amycolatopsis plumensis TaxID=236508 RepID=UPI00360E2872